MSLIYRPMAGIVGERNSERERDREGEREESERK